MQVDGREFVAKFQPNAEEGGMLTRDQLVGKSMGYRAMITPHGIGGSDSLVHFSSDVGRGGNGVVKIPRVFLFSAKKTSPVVLADKYNNLILREGAEEQLLTLLTVIAPQLEKLRYAKITDRALVYAGVGLPSLIPTSQMGEAFVRMINLYTDILLAETDVLLIDEIENGLHSSVYNAIWEGIITVALQSNVQVFATTHNKECLKAAFETASRMEEPDIFRHHRVQQEGGKIVLNSSVEILGAPAPRPEGY